MVERTLNYLKILKGISRVSGSLSRGGVVSALKQLDSTRPITWEFSAFSQSGGDGILDYLSRQIVNPNSYFIEIGSSDGLENNSAWFAIARKYNGLMVEGDSRKSAFCQEFMAIYNLGVECVSLFVNEKNIETLKKTALHFDPDLFSLDIDGMDYHVFKTLLENGFRPKIAVLEYNAVFGPHASTTLAYNETFSCSQAHPSELYYGVSVAGWKNLMKKYGYQFVTVDQNGVDAFFVDPQHFRSDFLSKLDGLQYRDNFFQRRKFKNQWQERLETIKHLNFVEIL